MTKFTINRGNDSPIVFDTCVYDNVLVRGLASGLGHRDGSMCIEAAVCYALGLKHSDDPECVDTDVAECKIEINDANWSTRRARSNALRELGIAQLGSRDTIDGKRLHDFCFDLVRTELFPQAVRDLVPDDTELIAKADALATAQSDQVDYLRNALATCLKINIEIRNSEGRPARAFRALRYIVAMQLNYDLGLTRLCNLSEIGKRLHEVIDHGDKNPNKYLKAVADILLRGLHEVKSPGCELLPQYRELQAAKGITSA